LPYKDPEVRKEFHRQYKRRWRALRANRLKKFRAYICSRFPNIAVGGARFTGGLLVTNSPAVQAAIEQGPDFFQFIFPVRLDFSGLTMEDEEVDD
jgi:hypothetical protein